MTLSIATIFAIPPATGQTTETAEDAARDCPPGFECIGSDPDTCLPKRNLIEHQQNIRECQRDNATLEGRVKECRDSESACKARVENLKASEAIWKSRAKRREERLNQWYRNPLVWAGIAVVVGGTGYLVGSLAPPDAIR